MRRVLKYTNAFVGLLLLVALGSFYQYVWKNFPVYSGDFALDVQKPASVKRDSMGIPHIEAASIEDAVYLQGYVHAQDRFWQMEATRRLASGELAEIVGPSVLERDIDSRRLRMRIMAQQMAKSLSEEDRKWFAAYARGVNDWLSAHLNHLPLEIQILNFTPKPWSMADTILLGLHMYRQLSTTWPTEADLGSALRRGEPDKLRQLFPLRSGAEIAMGSNAWAVGPSRAASGKALLAGDPHLEQSWPSTFYINHLKAGALDVIGGSLPGSPGVIIGHNQRIAWSMTNLHFDVQDLYFNENRIVGQQKETIRVRGAKDVELIFTLTPHGPVVERGGANLALRWAPFDGQYSFPFVELNLAQDWNQFRKALERFPGPSHNFIYADSNGNIGYQAAGRMPIRKTESSGLPLDATKPENEWFGYIPFADLPTAYNPSSGLLVSANQNPFPINYKYPVAGNFTAPYRQRQIQTRLLSQPKWKSAELAAVQKDVYSAFHHHLAKQLAQAAAKRNAAREGFAEARTLLEQWNGQMEVGQAAPMIVSLAYQHLRRTILGRAGANGELETQFAAWVMEDLLNRRPRDWFPDFDQVLVEALVAALEEGAKTQGKNPRYWDYGRYSLIQVSNPVLAPAVNVGRFLARPGLPLQSWIERIRLPFIDNYVQAGPYPLSGGSLTVKQVSSRVGAAFRFIADTADWDRSYFTITLGQSGHVFSRHGRDYWNRYYNGEPVPLPYKNFRANDHMRVRPNHP